jgi:hypothetical protein
VRSVDEVIAFLRRSQVEGEHTQHVNGDVLVEVDGDGAEASANQLVHYYRTGEPPHRRSGLRLAYTAVRTPAGWRFPRGAAHARLGRRELITSRRTSLH